MNLTSSSGSFSVDIFSISSMVGDQGVSFEDWNASRTSLMEVATSLNFCSKAARYDAAMAFEIDISALKTNQNEMQPFHDTLKRDQLRNTFIFFNLLY